MTKERLTVGIVAVERIAFVATGTEGVALHNVMKSAAAVVKCPKHHCPMPACEYHARSKSVIANTRRMHKRLKE